MVDVILFYKRVSINVIDKDRNISIEYFNKSPNLNQLFQKNWFMIYSDVVDFRIAICVKINQ